MPTVVRKKSPRRVAATSKPRGPEMNKLIRDPLTGLMITARRRGQKLITSEDVARAIAE